MHKYLLVYMSIISASCLFALVGSKILTQKSCTVKKIQANFCFSIFGKNLKIQNGRHFWEEENFLKIAKSTFLRYPMGRKFQRNNYFARLRQICVFPFLGKIRKFKMAAIFGKRKIF